MSLTISTIYQRCKKLDDDRKFLRGFAVEVSKAYGDGTLTSFSEWPKKKNGKPKKLKRKRRVMTI